MEGYFWNSLSSSECDKCSDAVDCESSAAHRFLGSLNVKQGWHRFSNSSTEVYDCSLYHRYHAHCDGGPLPGDTSCRDHSEGPLCGLCEDGYFHPGGDKSCEKCGGASIAQTLVPILVVIFVGTAGLVAWRVKFFSRMRMRIEDWSREHSVNLDWILIGGRIVFFDYQIITKFSESKI